MRTLFWVLFALTYFSATAQDVDIIKSPKLYAWLGQEVEKPRIINFWATWCKPCIEELPYFDKINAEGKADVMLVSLDPVSLIDKVSAVKKRFDIKSKTVILDESDFDAFINRISEDWSGAIPATIIQVPRQAQYAFFEKKFEQEELEQELSRLLSK